MGRRGRARRPQGHPARVAAHQRKRAALDALSTADRALELERRRIVALVSRELAINPQEGALVGPLAAAATRAAEILCEHTPGLEDQEHRHGVACYLTERLGDALDEFSVVDYRNWRAECLRVTEEVSAERGDHRVGREEADAPQATAVKNQVLADNRSERRGLAVLDATEDEIERPAEAAPHQLDAADKRDHRRPDQLDVSEDVAAQDVIAGSDIEDGDISDNDRAGHE